MNAQEWKMLLSAYADGEVSPQDAAQAQKLINESPECRQYFDELRRLSTHLQSFKDENLSPDAQVQVFKKVKKENAMRIQTLKAVPLLVVALLAGSLVLQNYVQRGVQGRLKSSIDNIGDQYSSLQSKPYYAAARKNSLTNVYSPVMKTAMLEQRQRGDLPNAKTSAVMSARMTAMDANVRPIGGIQQGMVAMQSGEARMRIGIQTATYAASPSMATDSDVLFSPYPVQPYVQDGNTEEYSKINDNQFLDAAGNPLSTFSIDVDTASYSNVRRFLTRNQMPPKDAVRLEEMINYFSYDYPKPEGKDPFSITTDLAVCPWNKDHQLLRIGLKGRTPDASKIPPSNLVFLIDVSGSMNEADKLPLLKEGFKMMVDQLRAEDKVSIVVYAGNAGQVLAPTSGDEKETIKAALDALQAGGSTAGGQGMELAYRLAKDNFIKDGNNRVVWATDGDFNVGVSSTAELVRKMADQRKDGIFLTLLGFGQGNLKDSRMQQLADQGNGNYYYIDGLKEARKVLVSELGSTLYTIAKDVKIQIEFNPAAVKSYRLVGYEKRILAKEDFNNDQKDAGEIGAGHTVTALYELVPEDGQGQGNATVDPLKYQKAQTVSSKDVMTVKLRYKEPDGDTSKLLTRTIGKSDIKEAPAGDFAWAAAVSEFGMLLRNSKFKGTASYDEVLKTAKANTGDDKAGLRAEFINLVQTARGIAPSGNGQLQFK